MVNNSTPEASQHACPTSRALWHQQYAYHSGRRASLLASRAPPLSASFAPVTYEQIAAPQPVPQYGNGMSYEFTPHAPAPYQYPTQYSYAVIAPAIFQNNYYALPANNCKYNSQYHQPWVPQQQNNWPEHGNPNYNSLPWAAQEQNNRLENRNSWQQSQESDYNQRRHAGNAGNASNWSNSSSASGGYSIDSYSSAYEAQPSQRRRDSYRPSYANSLSENEHTIPPSHQYPRPAPASGSGPRNSGRRGAAYTPLSFYATQREQYERDHPYPIPPAYSDPFALPQDTTPFVPRRVSGIEPSKATEFISAYRQMLGTDNKGRNDARIHTQQVSHGQVQPCLMTGGQDASAQSQLSPVDVKDEAPDADHDGTNITHQHDAASHSISEDLVRRLSGPDMQVIVKSEATATGEGTVEAVAQAADPTQAGVDSETVSVEATVEHVEGIQVQAKNEPTITGALANSTNAGRVTLDDNIDALGDLLPEVSEDVQATVYADMSTAEALDRTTLTIESKIQETVTAEAVDGITLPDGDKTQETVTEAADDASPVMSSATKTADSASTVASTAADTQERTPQNNRRKRCNKKWRQKASVEAANNRLSALTVSRNQGSNGSPDSRSSTTSASSPPNKRIKDEPISSPIGQPPGRYPPPAANGWGNFFTHIKQDDQTMAVKAKEEYKRLGGDMFRPEIKETYKDQKGVAESKIHKKVGGPVFVKKEASVEGDVGSVDVKKEDSDEEGIGGVKVEPEMSPDVIVEKE